MDEAETDLEDLLDDAYPDCERCGTRLEPAGELKRLRWECPSCGLVAISQ